MGGFDKSGWRCQGPEPRLEMVGEWVLAVTSPNALTEHLVQILPWVLIESPGALVREAGCSTGWMREGAERSLPSLPTRKSKIGRGCDLVQGDPKIHCKVWGQGWNLGLLDSKPKPLLSHPLCSGSGNGLRICKEFLGLGEWIWRLGHG